MKICVKVLSLRDMCFSFVYHVRESRNIVSNICHNFEDFRHQILVNVRISLTQNSIRRSISQLGKKNVRLKRKCWLATEAVY